MDKPKYIIKSEDDGGIDYHESDFDTIDDMIGTGEVSDGDTVFEISRVWKVEQPKIKFVKVEE